MPSVGVAMALLHPLPQLPSSNLNRGRRPLLSPPAPGLPLTAGRRHQSRGHPHGAADASTSLSLSLLSQSLLVYRRRYSSLAEPFASEERPPGFMMERRRLMLIPAITIGIASCQYMLEKGVAKAEFADMPALRGKDYGKTKMRYPDYTETESGLQYKDLRVGVGPSPKKGETVVVDWDGYTIGYYGRIFEARNKTKGGSFEGGDKDFFKFKVGSGQVIPAFEEAILGMAPGGVRRIIVPPDLGYPDNDYNKLGPKPMTFSGQRALDFVLRNQGLIDKTLLFDIELLKIIPNQ